VVRATRDGNLNLTTTEDYRRTATRKPAPLPAGLDSVAHAFVGASRRGTGVVHELLRLAEQVDAQAGAWRELSDADLRERLREFRGVFRRRGMGRPLPVLDALAAVREAADRCVGLRAYVVQLAGALALYGGYVAEMATGEGKTLTAGLTAVLNGWEGVPCHVVTVNDYLAQRDAEWLASLYEFCGLAVGYVTGPMSQEERRAGHHRDITYTTSKEIVADFLRDRLWLGSLQNAGRRQIRMVLGRRAHIESGLVMRGIHTAIVDEADSILIDEAVTPLIISRAEPNNAFVEACRSASRIAETLEEGRDYRVDRKYNDIDLGPAIHDRLDAATRGLTGMSRGLGRRPELIRQALTAKEFFHRDNQYVVQDEEVVIVDEFTGRLMPQRRWRAGLHQFIEAKERVPVTPPSETLARLSFQRFFRFFFRLSGMTGTASESAAEFWQIYRLPVVSIPQNRRCQRVEFPLMIFADRAAKWRAIAKDILLNHVRERPVLVGTRSVEASERLACELDALGLPYRLLNAVHHREEARIVAHAGENSAVTIATNMAGRGTDILLGPGVAALGGLHVIASECHEAYRIDRQLFGRCARQGDPGSARGFVSTADELLRRFVPSPVRRACHGAIKQGVPGSQWTGGKLTRYAQATAQRWAFLRRRAVLKMDTWLEDSLSFAQADVE